MATKQPPWVGRRRYLGVMTFNATVCDPPSAIVLPFEVQPANPSECLHRLIRPTIVLALCFAICADFESAADDEPLPGATLSTDEPEAATAVA